MRTLYELMGQAGPSSASVLIVGESGTGKELVARTLHLLSPRSKGPFIAVNCAAIPEALLESELFGHEKGAFTGAHHSQPGLFEFAHGGTLFLDEMSIMPSASQVKLLRVLEDQSFRRVRGQREIQVDVRVIAAMNRTPEELVHEGKLRPDLYYRLNVFTLRIPPLRDRPEDVPLLVSHFIREFNGANGKAVVAFKPEALQALQKYRWPGNVRELRNVVERSVILASGPYAELTGDTPGAGNWEPSTETKRDAASSNELVIPIGRTTIEQAVRDLIMRTLDVTGYNKTRAARILGISTKSIYNKLREWAEPTTKAAGP